MVSRDEVFCPRCGTSFVVDASAPETVSVCPQEGCGWQTSRHAYHQSWRKKRIWGHNAITFFEEYYEQYDPKLAYKEKVFLIDHLIHQFCHKWFSSRGCRFAQQGSTDFSTQTNCVGPCSK